MLMRKLIALFVLLFTSTLFAQTPAPEYKIEKLADGLKTFALHLPRSIKKPIDACYFTMLAQAALDIGILLEDVVARVVFVNGATEV